MSDLITITRRHLGRLANLRSGKKHKIAVKTTYRAHMLEVEDVNFHHDSAVLLPDYNPQASGQDAYARDQVTALMVLVACYRHASDHPDQSGLVVGHTDRSGSAGYNQALSELRADNVHSLLLGARSNWVQVCRQKHQVEDYQQILRWLTHTKGWTCDPGTKDGVAGPKTRGAVKAFQQQYNGAFNGTVAVTGVVDSPTWGAFYDVYVDEMKALLNTDDNGLAAARQSLRFVQCAAVGCGEGFPITSDRAENYRNAVDRRVEILFFDPGEEPKLECHAPHGACSELYEKKMYRFVPVPVTPIKPRAATKKIWIQQVDDHFAPKHEQLEVSYEIKGLGSDKVELEITSPHYKKNPIYVRELTDDEKGDGRHTLQWDGRANTESGELKDGFVHPLYGPYTVRITDGGPCADEAGFDVLYHSIAVHEGPWTPDEAPPEEADEAAWVQYKLNELGYFAGPVDGTKGKLTNRAIVRYKANHEALHQLDYSDYDHAITPALKDALDKGDAGRTYVSDHDFGDASKTIKVRVEALTYEEGEFGASKARKEKQRLNPPTLPIEATIYLKAKDGSKVSVPEAVGPARVNWRYEDPDENLAPLPGHTNAEPSHTRAYVEKCLKLKAGRRAQNGDNCHKRFGGIRQAPASNWKSPFRVDKSYVPYAIKKDRSQRVVYTHAHADATTHPKRLGRAGIFFRPSNVAGDDYRITAELDFTGLPNKAELAAAHGVTDVESRLRAQTGRFEIWRFNRVAMLVNWPARSGSNQWAAVKGEFESAYLDIDVSSIDTKKIADVLTEADYKKIVQDHTSHSDASKISLEDDSIVGVALPAQGGLNAGQYRAALSTFVDDNYWDRIYTALREKLSEEIRKTHPVGFIVVDFLTHKPVDILRAPPGDASVAIKDHVTWTFSIGLPDSVIFLDQKDPDKVYYVAAHEMGHNFWLQHWEHAGGSRAKDHDRRDHNCLMSYSSASCAHAHHRPGTYTPHFCGQCNLKLRGWDIDKRGIPADSS